MNRSGGRFFFLYFGNHQFNEKCIRVLVDSCADCGACSSINKSSASNAVIRPTHVTVIDMAAAPGTDVGFPYIFPGFSLHDELVLLVQAGLTPMETLQAATRNPAKYLGLLDSHGSAEKGKVPNLLLLEANPLENISNTQRIAAVVLNGKLLPKQKFQQILSDAEEGEITSKDCRNWNAP